MVVFDTHENGDFLGVGETPCFHGGVGEEERYQGADDDGDTAYDDLEYSVSFCSLSGSSCQCRTHVEDAPCCEGRV